jgi:hypothetical protein
MVALAIAPVSPGLFTPNQAGLVAANLVRTWPGQQQSWDSIFQVEESGRIVAKPIVFGAEAEELSLALYCTGVRGRRTAQGVTVHVGERAVPVLSCSLRDWTRSTLRCREHLLEQAMSASD